jgi:signal transduction histidine kinase/ligand-binding sensor domain-containing protein
MKEFFYIAFFLTFTSKLFTQENSISFEHINIEHGLSQNSIYSIIQDKKGFLWFGTHLGLCRYNGYDFDIYRRIAADINSLSSNSIQIHYEDNQGISWIGTNYGLNKFIPDQEKFIHFLYKKEDPNSLSDNNVTAIVEDKSGNLWIGTSFGLNKFDKKKNIFYRYHNDQTNPNSISSNVITSLCPDKNGDLWIGTKGGGLNKLILSHFTDQIKNNPDYGSQEIFVHFRNNPKNPKSINSDDIKTIYEDRSGNIWVGTQNNGLIKMSFPTYTNQTSVKSSNPDKNVSIKFYKANPKDKNSLSSNEINVIYEDSRGNLWIGTNGGGLNIFKQEKFIRIQNDLLNPYSLSSNYILSILEDKSRNVWIGTYSGGLNKYNKEKNKFKLYRANPLIPKGLSSNLISTIYEDKDGEFWIGTKEELNKFDREAGKFTYFNYNPNDPGSISDGRVRSICEDKFGRLWFGTQAGGLNILDKKSGKFKRILDYPHNAKDKKDFRYNPIRTILPDRTGNLWIGTYRGLMRYNLYSGEFIEFLNDPQDSLSINDSRIWALYEDRNSNLWIGTREGLNRYNQVTGKFIRYKFNYPNSNSYGDYLVLSICEDVDGIIWIGTLGSGLCNLHPNLNEKQTGNDNNPNNHLITRIPFSGDFYNNAVYGILKDKTGHLWFSTNNGLWKIDPKTHYTRRYDIFDGLQDNEFNSGAYFKTKDGEMFFGGNNGFNSFYPDSLKDNTNIPTIVITAFRKLDKVVKLEDNISNIKETELSYNENFFSFEFAALDYTSPIKNQYSYKLEGFDKDWISCGIRRYTSYTNLDGGEYTFRVRGSNNDGIWNMEGTAVKIKIYPPFWNSWWFRVIGLIATISIILLVPLIRVRNLRKQAKKLESIVNERTRDLKITNEKLIEANNLKTEFLNIAVHDLKNPLSVIATFSNMLKEDPDNKSTVLEIIDSISQNAGQMLNIVNNLLTTSRFEGEVIINKNPVNINEIVNFVVKKNQPLAEKKSQKIILTLGEACLIYADESLLMEAIENLINNAIKYSPRSKSIQVGTKKFDSSIRLEVKDEGPGLSENDMKNIFGKFQKLSPRPTGDELSTGLGLSIVKKIIELHDGKVWVETEPGKGSKFIIELAEYVEQI